MDASEDAAKPYRIGIFPVSGFALMSYACTVEPFRAANLLSGKRLYDVTHFTAEDGCTSSGAAIVPRGEALADAPPLDLLLVIAGGDPLAFTDKAALRWLARMSRRGALMGGVSGGPAILARAGLMEGRRMTVHWEHAVALAELLPGLMIERRLYVIDRDRVTCGGGTAPLDMTHALIAQHHGAPLARLVSDWFLHTDIRPAAGPQRGGLSERLGTTSRPVLDAVAAMEDHIADPLSLPQIAARAGVTPRQLLRLFEAKLGASPMAFYRRLRLETAQRLLSGTPLPITEIALATGFSGSSHFSSAFREQFGRPPSSERETGATQRPE